MKVKLVNGKIVYAVAVILGIVFLSSICWAAFVPIIVGDETFSMKLVQHSYFDIAKLTAMDVHPPLYYWILKTITLLKYLLPIDVLILAKLASVLPYFILTVLSFTKIRRLFGIETAVFFFLCIMGMPKMMHYAVEVRMYSWGMLFLVLLYLAFYEWMQKESLDSWKQSSMMFAVWGGVRSIYPLFCSIFSSIPVFVYVSLGNLF